MKTITKYLMPRFTWFMLWFKQWFKNPDGIKGFAEQVMNWLMQTTMSLAEKLKNSNRKLEEEIKRKKEQLNKWYKHPIVEADEWDEIKHKVIKWGIWITIGIIAEAALNYFGISSIITAQGLGWLVLNVIIALVLTGFGVFIFKQFFAIMLNIPMYKSIEYKERNWFELVLIALLCIVYEATIYYLCKIRGRALEGNTGDDIITLFVTLAGMLLPLIAGYLANERSRYTNPFNNSLRINKAEKEIATMGKQIVTNNQRMEDHFKQELQKNWAFLEEYKVYKQNYNFKNGIEKENVVGHFSETYDAFEHEAVLRYQKEVLQQTTLKPNLILAKEQMNGHNKELVFEINQ